MEMMDNTKCKDQCQDDSPCVWPRDLNNPGKISIDKCIPPTMELKGNGNKERKETGIVFVVLGLVLQVSLLLSEILSMDFMSKEKDRTQMENVDVYKILFSVAIAT